MDLIERLAARRGERGAVKLPWERRLSTCSTWRSERVAVSVSMTCEKSLCRHGRLSLIAVSGETKKKKTNEMPLDRPFGVMVVGCYEGLANACLIRGDPR